MNQIRDKEELGKFIPCRKEEIFHFKRNLAVIIL